MTGEGQAFAVTPQGQRFTNEGNSYHDFVQAMVSACQGQKEITAWLLCAAAATLPSLAMPADAPVPDDPYLWLEDVQGDKALAWVRERNAETLKQIAAREDYAPTRTKLLEVLNSRDRIPMVARRGEWLYNLWQDADHKRGLWRRTSLAEYRKPAPQWETVIDLDALAAAEKENWVWGGAECLGPDYRRCLVSLSRGGADAKVMREFDSVAKRFVDGGFALPEAKSDVAWIDADTLYIGGDFGGGFAGGQRAHDFECEHVIACGEEFV